MRLRGKPRAHTRAFDYAGIDVLTSRNTPISLSLMLSIRQKINYPIVNIITDRKVGKLLGHWVHG